MCGRYYLEPEREEIESIIQAVNRRLSGDAAQASSGDMFPSGIAPVYVAQAGRPALVPMKWGFGAAKGSRLIINARSETAEQKPLFREAATARRCLIPASGYYEWETRGKEKIQYAIFTPGEKIIYMAGLFQFATNAPHPAFVILTREAALGISFMHDRMPLILGKEARRAWMRGGPLREAVSASIETVEARAV